MPEPTIRDIAYSICDIPYHRLSQRQIAFLGPLEWRNLFGQKSKVVIYQKLIKRSGVRFLVLLVLMDAILLRRGLYKGTTVKKNFEAIFVITWV